VHEAIFEHIFGHGADALGNGIERTELCLHVGREAGIWRRTDIYGLRTPSLHIQFDPVRAAGNRCSGFTQFAQHSLNIPGPRFIGAHPPAGNRAGHEERAGLDPVRQHLILGAVQTLDTIDRDAVRAGAGNTRAKCIQKIGQIDDLRFTRGIFEHGLAFGQHGSHHQVLGTGHRHLIEDDMCAMQVVGPGTNVTVFNFDLGTHRPQPGDMQIDRTCADRATAR